MPNWKKAPAELTARFNALLPEHPAAEPRKMFGYAACFVNGNFFIGLHEENVVVRLPGGLEQKLAEVRSSAPFDPMGGRPMKGWFVVPKAVVASDAKLGAFIAKAFEEVRKLPAKVKGEKKVPAKKAASAPKKAPAKKAPATKAKKAK